MNFEHILPVITLLIGWFLNAIDGRFRSSKEDRKNMAKAIADLLEIRHRFIVPKIFFNNFAGKFQLSDDDMIKIKDLLVPIFPRTDDIAERFEETVTLISSIDPILGFRLRSKPLVGTMLEKMKAHASDDVNKAAYFRTEEAFTTLFIPYLESLILDLAKRHSRRTLRRVQRIFRESSELPQEIEHVLSIMQQMIQVT